jgi:putative transposase
MPRSARIAPGDYVYHILTRGNNRQDIFQEDEDFKKYMELLSRYKEKYKFKLYHYVLMTNHVHLVLEPTEMGGGLAEIMKGINLSYAQHYKRKYKHIGHFWQDRYKSIIISKYDYLLACGSYVELNPVRAMMVTDPKDYQWSSYNAYAHGQNNPLIDEHPIYSLLSEDESERRKKYRELVKGMLLEKAAMKGEMNRRVVYGDDVFTKEVASKYRIAAVINPVGRPKKTKSG